MPDQTGPKSRLGLLVERLQGVVRALNAEDEWAAPLAFLQTVPTTDPPRLERLRVRLGLGDPATNLVLFAGLPDAHAGFADLFRRLHPDHTPRPTIGLAARLIDDLAAALAGPAVIRGAIRRVGLDEPYPEQSLRLAPGLWAALEGRQAWLVPAVDGAVVAAGLTGWQAEPAVQRAVRALTDRAPVYLHVTAALASTGVARARVLAAAAGVDAVALRWPTGTAIDATALGLQAVLSDAVPIIEYTPPPNQAAQAAPRIVTDRPIIMCTPTGVAAPTVDRAIISLPIARLRPSDRVAMWSGLLPELADAAPTLAARYPVEPAVAAHAAIDARQIAGLADRAIEIGDVALGVSQRSSGGGTRAARRVRPRATWADLVLPTDKARQLREIVARLHAQPQVLDDWGFARGRTGVGGARILLVGPPGTGKTLTAEVLASAMGADLLQVDLSQVVSKWIGETEKNLSAVFDTAERSTAVLFFDEADALFGRRTEVRDAHDRHANLETAYLLARLEQYEGLVVLATNLRRNIDPAFLRRLDALVEYPAPDRAARARIWALHVPDRECVAPEVDFDRLARRYAVTGALIRNAALAAAFLAADEGCRIQERHFHHAMRREYAKSGRAFPST